MIKQIPIILIGLILASWVVAIAILSVQNATSVELSFFALKSIQMPVGVVLSIASAVGVMAGAIAPSIWHK